MIRNNKNNIKTFIFEHKLPRLKTLFQGGKIYDKVKVSTGIEGTIFWEYFGLIIDALLKLIDIAFTRGCAIRDLCNSEKLIPFDQLIIKYNLEAQL